MPALFSSLIPWLLVVIAIWSISWLGVNLLRALGKILVRLDEVFQRLESIQKAADARHKSALNSVGSLVALVSVRRAELAQAKQQLADAQIVAPYNGMVEERHVSPGEHVEPGSAIVTLVQADTLRYRAGVPERGARQVRAGQSVLIFLDGEDKPLEATVSRVSPALTLSSRALWIEADVPNPEPRRRTGLFAEAEIVVNPRVPALTVPDSAVAPFAGIEKVWTVRDGRASETPVRTGRRREHRIEILKGLSAGDLVVVNSHEGQAGAVTAVTVKTQTDKPGDERRTAASRRTADHQGSE